MYYTEHEHTGCAADTDFGILKHTHTHTHKTRCTLLPLSPRVRTLSHRAREGGTQIALVLSPKPLCFPSFFFVKRLSMQYSMQVLPPGLQFAQVLCAATISKPPAPAPEMCSRTRTRTNTKHRCLELYILAHLRPMVYTHSPTDIWRRFAC